MRQFLAAAIVSLLAAGTASARKPGEADKPVLPKPEPAARCSVAELHATHATTGMDPQLANLRDLLSKPPFSAWSSFRLLGRAQLAASRGRAVKRALPSGSQVTLLFKEKLVSAGSAARLRMGLDLDDAAGHRAASAVLLLTPGETVLVAGGPFQSGTSVLAVSCESP